MDDLRKLVDSLPHKPFFGVALLAWLALFHLLGNANFGYVDSPSLFGWLYPLYQNNPDDGLGMMVPFVSLVLLWIRRDQLVPLPKDTGAPALGLVAACLVLHLLGYQVQQARLSLVGFLTGLYGLTGLFWGRAWMRASVFPFALLLFCIPVTAYLNGVTFYLRLLVAQLATGFCTEVLHMRLLREGTAVYSVLPDGTRGFQFEVEAACSGIRSLTAVLLLTLVHGWLTLRSGWRRVLLVVSAPVFAVLGNLFRLVVVFVVGESFGEKAGAAIENKFGFITFIVALGGVVVFGRWLQEKAAVPAPVAAGDLPPSTPAETA
jgi:exosortase